MAESREAARLRMRRKAAAAILKKAASKKPTAKALPKAAPKEAPKEKREIPKGKNGGWRPNSGRPKGKLNSKTESLHAAYHRVFFDELSAEQRANLSPLDVFELMARAALEVQAWDEVLASTERLAPYKIQKLGPKTIPPPQAAPIEYDGTPIVVEEIIITGGTPKRRSFETALGRGGEDDVD